MSSIEGLSAIDKVSVVAIAKKIVEQEGVSLLKDLSDKLGIPLMSESRNRQRLLEKIINGENKKVETKQTQTDIFKKIISTVIRQSGAIQENNQRRTYAPWFKRFIMDFKSQTTFEELADLTEVSMETLMGFDDKRKFDLVKMAITDSAKMIEQAWNSAPIWQRRSLHDFWQYLGSNYSELKISSKEVREILIDLGLRYPRGPQMKDPGAQVKRCFAPHALWEGDGKLLKILINNHEYNYIWYAFVDQRTTLLVGSNIEPTESSLNFLEALKNGKGKVGFFPIGILIDNRLSDVDLSSINKFCIDHNITLVRTFPGNSKSNGNIENNFSIFETQVGQIKVTGKTESELARSIAQVVIEVFTQQRNHSPRKRLNGSSPDEDCKASVRPEDAKNQIEKLKSRLEKKQQNIEEKWKLIEKASANFGLLSTESLNKIKKQLGVYSADELITAQAAYLSQIAKHPENGYGPEYFLAILRHKRETKAKQIYNEEYRAGLKKKEILFSTNLSPSEAAKDILNELIEIQDVKTPTRRMLRLEAIAWWLVQYSTHNSLATLWGLTCSLSEINFNISLKWWQTINEYLYDLLGCFLFSQPYDRGKQEKSEKEIFSCCNFGHDNLSSLATIGTC